MGLYDTFVSPSDDEGHSTAVQVKFTQLGEGLPVYQVGDKIPLAIYEGVIIGYEGYVVINAGIVVQVGETIYDKWGGLLEPREIINSNNPIVMALSDLELTDLDDLKITDLEQVSPEEIKELIDLEEEVHEDFKIELPPVMLTNLEFNSLIALAGAVLRDESHELDKAIANLPPKVLELINK
jgi:hypothetical protein